ncbi:sigma 54-interacting transcriptional regulator [Mariniflexile jejuense]|uniref:Sigma 54-interacting transcriptional regulator n=1 Tax=Mariniflexile jejuense TaxID=1173582 RepID=A0ABW3JG83_9FLAO
MAALKILILEDNDLDLELIKLELSSNGFDFFAKNVFTKSDFTSALKDFKPDVILTDYNLPQFTGIEALEIAKKIALNIPFILVTGHLSEELAADSIKRGAWDYVLKTNLLRLGPAIENALKLKKEKDTNEIQKNKLLKLLTAVEQSSNSIVITDIYGCIEFTNTKFTSVSGYTATEVIGKPAKILKSDFHSEEFYTTLWNTITCGKTWSGEFRNKSKNGDLYWEQATITPIKDTDGTIINFLAVKEDITDLKKKALILKESQKNLIEAQRIAKIASFKVDLKTLANSVSPNFYEIIEVNFDEELTIENCNTAVHPDDKQNNIKILKDCINLGKKYDLIFRIITNRTKQLKWIHGCGEVIYGKGEPAFFVGTFQDITKEKNAELELKNSYNEIEHLKKQLETENVFLKEEISLSFNYENLVYASTEISDVLTQVEQVAITNATVLILGETGTGKELIAKAIHNISKRKNGPLIRVNCASIPTELLESELFGHVKGSFTGAVKDRIGKFQLADGGTLFLDEIGEMPLELQPKLLRAIQEGEIEPIGSSKLIKLNLRIIAATNRELDKEVKANRFRQDLFFRLNVFPITIPPLRDRIEDIPVLVDYFLNKFCTKYQKNINSISKLALQHMKSYHWPGNVRELENVIERAVITVDTSKTVLPDFDYYIQSNPDKSNNYNISLDEVQSNHIIKILNITNWKISGKDGAAALLGLKVSTLRDRMTKLGIKSQK